MVGDPDDFVRHKLTEREDRVPLSVDDRVRQFDVDVVLDRAGGNFADKFRGNSPERPRPCRQSWAMKRSCGTPGNIASSSFAVMARWVPIAGRM